MQKTCQEMEDIFQEFEKCYPSLIGIIEPTRRMYEASYMLYDILKSKEHSIFTSYHNSFDRIWGLSNSMRAEIVKWKLGVDHCMHCGIQNTIKYLKTVESISDTCERHSRHITSEIGKIMYDSIADPVVEFPESESKEEIAANDIVNLKQQYVDSLDYFVDAISAIHENFHERNDAAYCFIVSAYYTVEALMKIGSCILMNVA